MNTEAPDLRRRPLSSTIVDGKQKDTTSLPLNPFVHSIDLDFYDRIKFYVLTVLLLPIRAVFVILCLLTAYLLACLGTVGLSHEELKEKPMKGWRRQLRTVICWWMCHMFFHMGFYRVRIKGRRATQREAPILALAPHSSWVDAFPVVLLTAPSLVVKAQSQSVPFFHKLINYTQPVYVWRDDPNSRQKTIKEIQRRVGAPEDDWQQILIFPEGTCTNRKGLITFKPGAFIPGVPVQPVCIRYPNRLDTLSWTWQGPGAMDLIWMTMTQFVTYCELEFLPVYVPSEEEKCDPQLFADNVRDVMAKALNLPVTNYSYEDCRLMTKAQKLGLPPTIGLIEVGKIRQEFGLASRVIEDDFLTSFARLADQALGTIDIDSFAAYLHLPADHPRVIELFNLYDPDRSGVINFKNYARGRCVLSRTSDDVDSTKRDQELSWAKVKELLKLTPSQSQEIDGFVSQSVKSDANENDVLDHLNAVIPEWSWIVSGLSRHPLSAL